MNASAATHCLGAQVLKHLTVKRPLDVNRMDFFLQVCV